MTLALAVVSFGSLAAIAALCFKVSQGHRAMSIACYCIAEMLRDPAKAPMTADLAREQLQAEGLWKS